jgi:hypothetical protein
MVRAVMLHDQLDRFKFNLKLLKFNPYHAPAGSPEGGQFTSEGSESIHAFHGSPSEFARFDEEHEGKGHGVALYGHGLYLAENPDVAEGYRHVDIEEQRRFVMGPDTPRGYLYDVSVHAKADEFLDWDKPLAEQPQMVAKLQTLLSQPPFNGGYKGDDLGVYEGL